MQDKTCKQQTHIFSNKTSLPQKHQSIKGVRCLQIFWINPAVCWYCFLMLVLIIVQDYGGNYAAEKYPLNFSGWQKESMASEALLVTKCWQWPLVVSGMISADWGGRCRHLLLGVFLSADMLTFGKRAVQFTNFICASTPILQAVHILGAIAIS